MNNNGLMRIILLLGLWAAVRLGATLAFLFARYLAAGWVAGRAAGV
ncbi:MAG: hypothetical protein WBP44_16540 [Gammaproteobacteria bacterium]